MVTLEHVSRCFGSIWFYLIRTRRSEMHRRIVDRLAMTPVDAWTIVQGVYHHLGRSLLELAWRGPVPRGRWPGEVRGWENLMVKSKHLGPTSAREVSIHARIQKIV